MEGAEGVDGSLGVVEVDKLQMSATRPTSNETPCAELRGKMRDEPRSCVKSWFLLRTRRVDVVGRRYAGATSASRLLAPACAILEARYMACHSFAC